LIGGAAAGGTRAAAALAGSASKLLPRGGAGSVAHAGQAVAPSPLRRAVPEGADAGVPEEATVSRGAGEPPAWARRAKSAQTVGQAVSAVTHAVRSSDRGSGGAAVDLSEGGR